MLSEADHKVCASLRKHSIEHILVAGTDLGLGIQLRTTQKVLGFMGHFVLRASGSHNQGKNCFHTNISDTSECYKVNKLGQ